MEHNATHAARLIRWALTDAGMALPEGSASARPVDGEAWQAEAMTVTVRVATEATAEWIAGALAALGLTSVRRCVWSTTAGAPLSWEILGTATDEVLSSLDPRRVPGAPPLEPAPEPGPARRQAAAPRRAAPRPRKSRADPAKAARPCEVCGRPLDRFTRKGFTAHRECRSHCAADGTQGS